MNWDALNDKVIILGRKISNLNEEDTQLRKRIDELDAIRITIRRNIVHAVKDFNKEKVEWGDLGNPAELFYLNPSYDDLVEKKTKLIAKARANKSEVDNLQIERKKLKEQIYYISTKISEAQTEWKVMEVIPLGGGDYQMEVLYVTYIRKSMCEDVNKHTYCRRSGIWHKVKDSDEKRISPDHYHVLRKGGKSFNKHQRLEQLLNDYLKG